MPFERILTPDEAAALAPLRFGACHLHGLALRLSWSPDHAARILRRLAAYGFARECDGNGHTAITADGRKAYLEHVNRELKAKAVA